MMFRICRWSIVQQAWIEWPVPEWIHESNADLAKIKLKEAHYGCAVKIEWLVPRSERGQFKELERLGAL